MRAGWGLAGFALAAVVAGCGGDPQPALANEARPPNEAYVVDTATIAVPLEFATQLYVEHDAWVYARTLGVVESLHVDIGSRVRAGQVLAELERVDQAIALRRAQEAYDNADRTVRRFRELGKSGAVAVADSEVAELNYREAELALAQARRNEELTRITAPFDGFVAARTVRPGRLVESGDSLFRVAALAPLRAAVYVPELVARDLAVGARGRVVGLDGTTAEAIVIRASPIIDAASGTREVVLQLGADSSLRPGASVTVRLGEQRRMVVAIPRDAITESGYVLAWENGRTSLRAVSLGSALPDGRVEVTSGLAAGERVVLGHR